MFVVTNFKTFYSADFFHLSAVIYGMPARVCVNHWTANVIGIRKTIGISFSENTDHVDNTTCSVSVLAIPADVVQTDAAYTFVSTIAHDSRTEIDCLPGRVCWSFGTGRFFSLRPVV